MNRTEIVRQVIDSWSARPFSYGQDCCQFAGAVVEAIRGVNPMSGFNYSNKWEAYRIINEFGGLRAAVSSVLGEPCTLPLTDGDVTIQTLSDGREIVGVVYKDRSVVRTKGSVTDWPIERIDAAWSI